MPVLIFSAGLADIIEEVSIMRLFDIFMFYNRCQLSLKTLTC